VGLTSSNSGKDEEAKESEATLAQLGANAESNGANSSESYGGVCQISMAPMLQSPRMVVDVDLTVDVPHMLLQIVVPRAGALTPFIGTGKGLLLILGLVPGILMTPEVFLCCTSITTPRDRALNRLCVRLDVLPVCEL